MGSPAESGLGRRWKALLLGMPGLVLLGLALVLGGAAVLRWASQPEAKHADKVSAAKDPGPLLAASYPDLEQRPQAIKQWRGKVLVVNFWATWCGPCREEIPDLIRLHERFGKEPVAIIGLAIDQPDAVRGFVKEFGINYPMLVGGFSALDLARAAGNPYAVLPFTVIIDRQGKIAQAHVGRIPAERLDELIRQALR